MYKGVEADNRWLPGNSARLGRGGAEQLAFGSRVSLAAGGSQQWSSEGSSGVSGVRRQQARLSSDHRMQRMKE